MDRLSKYRILLVIIGGALASCDSATAPSYDPVIPSDLSSTITNPYFPFAPGVTYSYSGQTPDGLETSTSEVSAQPRVVNGVAALEVHDLVYLDGALIEDTFDWYAQDGAGNVWYLGEDTKEIKNGQVIGTTGSWEWGVGGALPGIIMQADPAAKLSTTYREEYLKGVAEDQARVIAVNQSATVTAGNYTGCIVTDNFTGLEPFAPHENKTYCPQVGLVLEVVVGGSERIELVGVTP
jgi:hypothetical protein